MTMTSLGRLLIVDDETELMAALCEVLKDQGYEVEGYASGKEAVDVLKDRSFDVLLTDLMMPGMDGIELLKSALEIDSHLVGIVMTGQGTVQTAVEAMKIGAFDYVLKPFKIGTIMPVLSRGMEVRRLRLENIHLRETVEIFNLSKVVALTLDANTIVSKIAESALQQCNADEVSVMLPTDDGKELYIATIRGDNREYFLGQRISIEAGIAGWVARSHETVLLNGEVEDKRFGSLNPRPDICSSVSMPMMAGGRLVGVLNVNVTKSRHQLNFGQVKALSILGGMAAPALENAWMYAQVRQAENEWKRTFDAIIDPIMILDTGHRIIKANRAMADKLGIEPSVAEGLTCYKEVHGMEGPIPTCPLSLLLTDRKTHTVEVYEERMGGHFLVSTSPLYTPHGALYGAVHYAKDITRRKLAEETLAKSEERFRRLVESVIDYIYTVMVENGRTVATTHSPACAAVTGYTAEEYDTDPDLWYRMVYEEDRGAVMEQSRHILAGEIPPPVEHRIIHKDGSIRWVRNTSVPSFDNEGRLTGYDGMITDITERKAAEFALQFRNLLLATQQEVSIDGILVVDGASKIVSFNRRFVEMWGIPAHIVESGDDGSVLQSELGKVKDRKEFLRRINYLYSHSDEKSMDEITLLDGRTFDRYSSPMFGEDGKYYGRVWYFRDITERKQLEGKLREHAETLEGKVSERTRQLESTNAELQLLNRELEIRKQESDEAKLQAEEATRAKSDFLANMSHELRTPLNSIIGFSEILKKGMFGQLSEKQDEFVGYIIGSGKHLLNLINDILDLSKVEAGKVELEVGAFNLIETLNASLIMFREKAMKHGISLKFDTGLDTNTEIEADERRLKQILFNLLSNAVKFTPDGGTVCLRAEKSGGEGIEISVEDTGIGIREEDITKLFKEFSQLESAYDKKYEGTGLGLALTKRLIELHGGRIRVDSEYGKGSKFSFVVPLRQGDGHGA
ncbi:MAG: PAS domain S-box protein [Nitrospirae bacterium]|nr:MAG: PAS domain S-box protein [Nitrospirota bacterium]